MSEEPNIGFELEDFEEPRREPCPDHEDGCCKTEINIRNNETVNVYSCLSSRKTTPAIHKELPALPPTGACVPLALGSKPKRSREDKLRSILERNTVPSVLAASFFQLARRFLLGREPDNHIEEAAFAVFRNLSSTSLDILRCSLRTFNALPAADQERLFAPEVKAYGDNPIDPEDLRQLLAQEIGQRTSLAVFDDPDCLSEERPGQPRVTGEVGDALEPEFRPIICRVNDLRTNTFEPALALGDYRPEELQQQCNFEVVDGQARINCRVQRAEENQPCPGNSLEEGTCLRVPEVAPGQSVVLQGVNFFNTEARIRIAARQPGAAQPREVQAHVCGDVTTPPVNENNFPINDCIVKDFLTFEVPADVPEGIYSIEVIVPNNTGLSPHFAEFTSEPQYIAVLPPLEDTFQIASVELQAVSETSPAAFGSDEVAVRILTIPIIGPDYALGELAVTSFRFDEVDSGEERRMNRVLFRESGNAFAGVVMVIVGHEVDNEAAFEQDVTEFMDAFLLVLRSYWQLLVGDNDDDLSVREVAAAIALAFGASKPEAAAIGAVIALATTACIALWAPADLIIEDTCSFTPRDLAMLTSPNFPPPPENEYESPGGITVSTENVSKGPAEFSERRSYSSQEEESNYQILFRYNRL